MQVRLNKRLCILLIILLLLPCSTIVHSTSYAVSRTSISSNIQSSWVPEDKTVYGKDEGEKISDSDEIADPGMLEGLLITFINAIGGFFKWFFGLIGLTLQNVVFGRVNGGGINIDGTRVALFTFELKEGNPYGIVGASVYSLMRGIIYIIIACVIFCKFAVVLFIGNSAKALNKFKEQFVSMIFGFALLTLMPYLIDLMLYIRDVIIYTIGVKGMSTLGISTPDLPTFFDTNKGKSFISALMYTGSYILTLYFAFQYIGIALSMVIDMFAFPFVVLNYQFSMKALGTWFKGIFSNALVPVVDCCLLMIPAVFDIIGDGSYAIKVIQLLICTMLIPARKEIRNVLGVSTNGGLELSGLMAMKGAGMALGAAVAGTVGAASGWNQSRNDAKSDENMANYYSELSKTEQGQGVSGMGIQGTGMAGARAMSMDFSHAPATDSSGNSYQGVTGESAVTGSLKGTNIPEGDIGSANGIDLGNPADKYANIHNFEDHAFANMSNARRAELYRQRAEFKRKQGNREAFARVGGTAAGMTAGLATTTFMSAGTKGIAMGALGTMGSNAAVSAVHHLGASTGNESPFTMVNNNEQDTTTLEGEYGEPIFNGTNGGEPVFRGVVDEGTTEDFSYNDKLSDMQQVNDYGIKYMNLNKDVITRTAASTSNMVHNESLKKNLDTYYDHVMRDNSYSTSDEKYQAFRQYAANEMSNQFRYGMENNGNLRSGGNTQLDNNTKEYIINNYKSKLEGEKKNGLNQKLSKANLDLNGYHFD